MKVTAMSRWPLYKGDRYGRFAYISSMFPLDFGTILTVSYIEFFILFHVDILDFICYSFAPTAGWYFLTFRS